MFAAHHRLDNLCVVVDYNQSQCMGKTTDVLNVDLLRVWQAFGWHAIEVDGHSIDQLRVAFQEEGVGRPKVVIARTILGKGVGFMEGRIEWHYRNLTSDLVSAALDELKGG